MCVTRLTQTELAIGALLYPERSYWRPQTRKDCDNVRRPCLYTACRHNLYLDRNPKSGSITFNFPSIEPWEMKHSCTLDLSDGGHTLEEVGEAMNLTRERVRQIEARALSKLLGTEITE